MMMLYKAFYGERILLSCSPNDSKAPEFGWTYADDDFFTKIVPTSTYSLKHKEEEDK
jgi:hypothetical protein